MIEIRDLRVTYGAHVVLDEVSLSVEAGGRTVLTGPNGAGKTTLLRCLLGQVRYTGTLRVGGHDVVRDGRRARRLIGYVPQLPSFPPGLHVDEVVAFFQRLRGEDAAPLPLLEAVGLSAAAGCAPSVLSGGMLRRLALAVALIGEPPLLVLDEPASNLDAEGEADLLGWLDRLHERGRTVLVASHHVHALRCVADRVVVLRGGRVTMDRPIAAFLDARCVALTVAGPAASLRAVADLVPAGLADAVTLNGVLHLSINQRNLTTVCAALDGPALRDCRVTIDVREAPVVQPQTPATAGGCGGEGDG